MNTWDRITARAAWGVLVLFTALSSYLNARAAAFDTSATAEWLSFHAAFPPVMLVAAMVAEMAAMSSMHRPVKAAVVAVNAAVFAVTLAASYVAVLALASTWNPHAPTWINAGLAAVPDLVMVMAGVSILSLRMRRHGLTPASSKSPRQGRLRRLADAATARAEAALTVPAPAADTSVDAVADPAPTVTQPSAKPATERPRTPRRAPAKPVADPALAPFMEEGERLAEARLIRGKTAVDYARILHAVDAGWSPTRIKSVLGFAHSTTHAVVEAATAAPTLAAVR